MNLPEELWLWEARTSALAKVVALGLVAGEVSSDADRRGSAAETDVEETDDDQAYPTQPTKHDEMQHIIAQAQREGAEAAARRAKRRAQAAAVSASKAQRNSSSGSPPQATADQVATAPASAQPAAQPAAAVETAAPAKSSNDETTASGSSGSACAGAASAAELVAGARAQQSSASGGSAATPAAAASTAKSVTASSKAECDEQAAILKELQLHRARFAVLQSIASCGAAPSMQAEWIKAVCGTSLSQTLQVAVAAVAAAPVSTVSSSSGSSGSSSSGRDYVANKLHEQEAMISLLQCLADATGVRVGFKSKWCKQLTKMSSV
jgi:hypothetical protein